eukprot:g18850.t1
MPVRPIIMPPKSSVAMKPVAAKGKAKAKATAAGAPSKAAVVKTAEKATRRAKENTSKAKSAAKPPARAGGTLHRARSGSSATSAGPAKTKSKVATETATSAAAAKKQGKQKTAGAVEEQEPEEDSFIAPDDDDDDEDEDGVERSSAEQDEVAGDHDDVQDQEDVGYPGVRERLDPSDANYDPEEDDSDFEPEAESDLDVSGDDAAPGEDVAGAGRRNRKERAAFSRAKASPGAATASADGSGIEKTGPEVTVAAPKGKARAKKGATPPGGGAAEKPKAGPRRASSKKAPHAAEVEVVVLDDSISDVDVDHERGAAAARSSGIGAAARAERNKKAKNSAKQDRVAEPKLVRQMNQKEVIVAEEDDQDDDEDVLDLDALSDEAGDELSEESEEESDDDHSVDLDEEHARKKAKATRDLLKTRTEGDPPATSGATVKQEKSATISSAGRLSGPSKPAPPQDQATALASATTAADARAKQNARNERIVQAGQLYKNEFKVKQKPSGVLYYYNRTTGKRRVFRRQQVARTSWTVTLRCNGWWKAPEHEGEQLHCGEEANALTGLVQHPEREQERGEPLYLDVGKAVEAKYGSFKIDADISCSDDDQLSEPSSDGTEDELFLKQVQSYRQQHGLKAREKIPEEKLEELKKKRKAEKRKNRKQTLFMNAHRRAPDGSKRLESAVANMERRFAEAGALMKTSEIMRKRGKGNYYIQDDDFIDDEDLEFLVDDSELKPPKKRKVDAGEPAVAGEKGPAVGNDQRTGGGGLKMKEAANAALDSKASKSSNDEDDEGMVENLVADPSATGDDGEDPSSDAAGENNSEGPIVDPSRFRMALPLDPWDDTEATETAAQREQKLKELLHTLKLVPVGVANEKEYAALFSLKSTDSASDALPLRPLAHIRAWLLERVLKEANLPSYLRKNLPTLIRNPAQRDTLWRWERAVKEDLNKDWWSCKEDFIQLPFPGMSEKEDELWCDFCYRLAKLSPRAKPMSWREFVRHWTEVAYDGNGSQKIALRNMYPPIAELFETRCLKSDVFCIQLSKLALDPTGRTRLGGEVAVVQHSAGGTKQVVDGNNNSTSSAPSASAPTTNVSPFLQQRKDHEKRLQDVTEGALYLRKLYLVFRMAVRANYARSNSVLPKRNEMQGWPNETMLFLVFFDALKDSYIRDRSLVEKLNPDEVRVLLEMGPRLLRMAVSGPSSSSYNNSGAGAGAGGGQHGQHRQQLQLASFASGSPAYQAFARGLREDIQELRPAMPLAGPFAPIVQRAEQTHIARVTSETIQEEARLYERLRAAIHALGRGGLGGGLVPGLSMARPAGQTPAAASSTSIAQGQAMVGALKGAAAAAGGGLNDKDAAAKALKIKRVKPPEQVPASKDQSSAVPAKEAGPLGSDGTGKPKLPAKAPPKLPAKVAAVKAGVGAGGAGATSGATAGGQIPAAVPMYQPLVSMPMHPMYGVAQTAFYNFCFCNEARDEFGYSPD